MKQVFVIQHDLTTEVCFACGTPFALSTLLFNALHENHKTFYCPNGHSMIYPAKTEAEKLAERLAMKQQEVEACKETIETLETQHAFDRQDLDKCLRRAKRLLKSKRS